MRSLPAWPGVPAGRARRFAVAVLLVLAALLGTGAGGPVAEAVGAEPRTATSTADPAAEVHDLTESEATTPVRGARRPARFRGVRTAVPGGSPAPPATPVPAPRDDAPRSAVMRC